MFAQPVPRLWPDSTIVCVGAGPSLTLDDCALIEEAWADRDDLRVIVVNSAYTQIGADVLYAADAKWWRWQQEAGVRDAELPAYLFSSDYASRAFRPSVRLVDWRYAEGLDDDPARVATGGHSGYQAINLAVHLGARSIILVGYDMMAAVDGRHHCHPEHPDGNHPRYVARIGVYETLLAPLAARGISIVNASRQTAITAIPRLPLDAALAAAAQFHAPTIH